MVTVQSDSQKAFMLPLVVNDSLDGGELETFQPMLGRAIAVLLPEEHREKDRLQGNHGMLEFDLKHFRGELEPPFGLEIESDHPDNVKRRREEKAATWEARRQKGRILRASAHETRELLARGINPSSADDSGQTALMHAAFPPFDGEKFRVLLEAGADLEARRTHDGYTGLHLACAGGEAAATAAWVASGANVHAGLPDNTTPLMLAAKRLATARLLLDAGAEVNAVDDDDNSALHYAIHEQSDYHGVETQQTIQLLIAAGADLSLRNKQGQTPLGLARYKLREVEVERDCVLAMDSEVGMLLQHLEETRQLAEAVVKRLTSASAS
jgi:ankyrin repeat protein